MITIGPDVVSLFMFVSAVAILLLAPGPTNTLMGLAGAQGGLRRVGQLLPAELLGYLTAILPAAYAGAAVLERWPYLRDGLTVLAALWVMFLAVTLWGKHNDVSSSGRVTAGKVFVTTMLNPKALIFALVLLPPLDHPDYAAKLLLIGAVASAVALIWGAAGRLTSFSDTSGHRIRLLQRVASVWLAVVSFSLIVGLVST